MSLHDELLATARRLIAGAPTDADARRAVSTAYYALFHLLIDAAVVRLLPVHTPDQQSVLAREFEHRTIKSVCGRVIDAARRPGTVVLLERALGVTPSAPVPSELVRVAEAFTTLQQWRQNADYDRNPPNSYTLISAQNALTHATTAFADWAQLEAANAPIAQAFLVVLLTGEPKPR